jgi:ABC-type multidrug transport system fused ATPase/permease subunit
VIDGGRIVQDGVYEELAGTPGPFADLARRQSI